MSCCQKSASNYLQIKHETKPTKVFFNISQIIIVQDCSKSSIDTVGKRQISDQWKYSWQWIFVFRENSDKWPDDWILTAGAKQMTGGWIMNWEGRRAWGGFMMIYMMIYWEERRLKEDWSTIYDDFPSKLSFPLQGRSLVMLKQKVHIFHLQPLLEHSLNISSDEVL